jgi:hypothetical protein
MRIETILGDKKVKSVLFGVLLTFFPPVELFNRRRVRFYVIILDNYLI